MVEVKLFWSLDAVERDAAGGLDRDRQPILFDRLSWYRLVAEHCPPPGTLLVARAKRKDGDRSWLFLSVRGRRASAYANWYTLQFRGGPHDAGNGCRPLDQAIAAALRQRGLVSVDLYPLQGPEDWQTSFRAEGWSVSAEEASATWIADVAGLSFVDYWTRRPAKLRNTVERKAKSADVVCSVYNDFDANTWTDYETVYGASWKPEEGSPAFLRALAEQEGAAGTFRLGIARKDGRPVAAQFWLVEHGRATIHKLAYREDAKQLSPGTLLSTAMFRHVIDVDRVDRIDFGLGDEPYKEDWMDRREPVGRMTAYNLATPAGLAGAARGAASTLVRRLRSN